MAMSYTIIYLTNSLLVYNFNFFIFKYIHDTFVCNSEYVILSKQWMPIVTKKLKISVAQQV